MGVKIIDTSVIQNEDPVSGLHTGNTLCDDDLGRTRDLSCKCRPDAGVCGCINGAGRVIQDQYLRFLKKSTCDTQTLFLPSGYVGASPLDPGVISVRHPVDELIGTGSFTCLNALLFCSARVTPAQVIQDRS